MINPLGHLYPMLIANLPSRGNVGKFLYVNEIMSKK
jgi:hypothetical protein